ncbi:Uncharacterised protein [Serratia marcescens]|nr:Uncharacterised protein [Serratia marcescens]CUY43473.1 Uncharacterised protein [Serratia marcescens]CVB06813.1 Uncharacterised protein [Serratia marcescens]CVE04027.1 Uncharacterised protein [Serratia marcescens]
MSTLRPACRFTSWSAAMAEPVTVRSLPALTLTLLPLSRLPFSRVVASCATLWLLLFFRKPFFCDRSSLRADSRSVAVLRVTSCFACRAMAPCSLCRALAVAMMLPSCATTVTPPCPLRVLPTTFSRRTSSARSPLVFRPRLSSLETRCSLSVVWLRITSFFACRAMAPWSLCRALPVTVTSPSRPITVTPSRPLKVLPVLISRSVCSSRLLLVLPSRLFSLSWSCVRVRASLMLTSRALTPIRPSLLSICALSANRRLPATRVTPWSPPSALTVRRSSWRSLLTDEVRLLASRCVVLVVVSARMLISPPACTRVLPAALAWLPVNVTSRPALSVRLPPALSSLPRACCHSPLTCAIREPAASVPPRVRLPIEPEITSRSAVWLLFAAVMVRSLRALRLSVSVASSFAPVSVISVPRRRMSPALMVAWRSASCRLVLMARLSACTSMLPALTSPP